MIGILRDIVRGVLAVVVIAAAGEAMERRPSVPAVQPQAQTWQPAAPPTWQPAPPTWQPEPRPIRRVGRAAVEFAESLLGVIR